MLYKIASIAAVLLHCIQLTYGACGYQSRGTYKLPILPSLGPPPGAGPQTNKPTDNTDGMNYTSGIYTATEPRNHLVTLTAQIANTNGNDGLFGYSQLFVLKNGKLESLKNYLLVEQNKVGDLRMEIHLKRKDTLEVFVGHHLD